MIWVSSNNYWVDLEGFKMFFKTFLFLKKNAVLPLGALAKAVLEVELLLRLELELPGLLLF